MVDIQKLYSITARAMKDVALKSCGVLQNEKPEVVVAGVACFFLAICKRYNLNVRRVLETTDRVMRDAEDQNPVEIRALHRYLKEELND